MSDLNGKWSSYCSLQKPQQRFGVTVMIGFRRISSFNDHRPQEPVHSNDRLMMSSAHDLLALSTAWQTSCDIAVSQTTPKHTICCIARSRKQLQRPGRRDTLLLQGRGFSALLGSRNKQHDTTSKLCSSYSHS